MDDVFSIVLLFDGFLLSPITSSMHFPSFGVKWRLTFSFGGTGPTLNGKIGKKTIKHRQIQTNHSNTKEKENQKRKHKHTNKKKMI